mmetsp:Transcript_36853/g.92370  ORF Transcript_36853/g.92370 Transcript_36853/m.92370 type:complete len:154 (-) Transcript_36853:65-526(-)
MQRDLNDEVEEEPVISLLVRVMNARSLLSDGDHYCNIQLGNTRFQTTVVHGTDSPRWNESFIFNIKDEEAARSQTLEVSIWDKNFLKDTFMGRIYLPFDRIRLRRHISSYFKLEGRVLKSVSGELHLKLQYVKTGGFRSRDMSEIKATPFIPL